MPPIVPVVRAETFYLPPPREPEDAWADTPAAELVYRYMEYRTQRRLVLPAGPVDETYFARINQNRWVADCVCGSAQVVSPTDPRYGCTECGWGWCALVFPADPAAVEAEMLLTAKPHLRNWWNPDDPANPYPPQPDPPTDPAPEVRP
ncbi:hypothetical protein OG369_09770 [Streptomyces sp. NBC_01221]|uniref:hypothetical protein n=1 Tax=Streptomyces sp. NBC_01221 TaxID=2903782 RepID=UPI00224EB45D|nr:hypothetical protein [Streptomyces sp. NBC_01221]MCX4786458.1 hypothetical protein [Streptomyces sp. NBC_01221]